MKGKDMHSIRPIESGVGWQVGRVYWQQRDSALHADGVEAFVPMFECIEIGMAMQMCNVLNGGDGGLSIVEVQRMVKGMEKTLMLAGYEREDR
jgi:hypothetical protein